MAANSHQQPVETKKANRPARKMEEEGNPGESMDSTISKLTNMDVKTVVREAKEFMEHPRESVMNLMDQTGAGDWLRTASMQVTSFVRRRPYATALGVLAIGALVFSRARKVKKA